MKKSISKTVDVLIPLLAIIVGGLLYAIEYNQVSNLTADTLMANGEFGPGPLPSWANDADVKLGWDFIDPFNPESTNPLLGWDIAIGGTPLWSYDANRELGANPAQWYIQIEDLYENVQFKHLWLCWNYEWDAYGVGIRSTTNLYWYPESDYQNFQYEEQLYDAYGNPTTNYELGVLAQGIMSVDILSNPEYEEIYLGLFNSNKKVLEVYIMAQCVEQPIIEPEEIGPGTLPDWHLDAQVQLGWIFDDPTNPQDIDLLPEWSQAIGDIPEWSFDANREYNEAPAQWYIRIPNLINNQTSKKVWISLVYEYDSSITEPQYAINIEWNPNYGMDNPMAVEELFDSEGNPTTDTSEAVYGRVTGGLDLYPNPEYEDIWLGIYGDSKNALEVYIQTLCVEEIEPEPETEIDISIDTWLSFIANENTELKQVIKVISSSTEIRLIIDIKQEGNGIPGCDLRMRVSGSVADTDISIDIDQCEGTTSVKVSLDVTLVGILNDIAVSVDISQSGSFTDFVLDTDINIGT
jgi:hypothetical protein